MPKARAPLDVDRYQDLHRQGLSLRQIAKELGMPESTLRDNLKVREKALASQGLPQTDQGPPQGDQGIPEDPPHVYRGPRQGYHGVRPPHVALGPPQPDQAETVALAGRALPTSHLGGPEDTIGGPQGPPDISLGGPPLYVHPGIPDSSEESIVGAEDIAEVHQGIPTVPAPVPPQGDQGPPLWGALSPQLVEALTTAWPDLVQMLTWWRDRQRLVQDVAAPERQLERQTYHIEKRFIEAVRREADLTGESYAAIVNRAFAQYFARKST